MTLYRYDADIIITGTGDLITNGSIVGEDKKIIYVGETEHAPNVENSKNVPVIMPGMWDSHVHLTGLPSPSLELMVFTNPLLSILKCVWDVKETLNAGFTSIRELGGYGIYLDRAISAGDIIGPKIYGAGKLISTTAGHADIHGLNLGAYTLLNSMNGSQMGELADGVSECLKAVRKQIRNDAQVIKYCSSGGFFPLLELEGYTRVDHPNHQQFSMEEQLAIVEEAARAELAVAAHCHGYDGIKSAIQAGVTSIEHGTFLDEELAELMVEKQTILVPTRYAYEKLVIGAEKIGMPERSRDILKGICNQHSQAIKLAIKHGVKIATGTDITGSGPNGFDKNGENALELKYLVDAGLKPMDAIVAATSHAAQTVGIKGKNSGRLEQGCDADFLVVNQDPVKNIEILTDPNNITEVIKQGKIVKNLLN